ncbi:hypothetical protein [Streptococcus caballi]|uniref:hypothetical protein n=1 Tax=Streptococcus caballi TaxID=439220 RepID=UPI000360B6FB|nr:hypothetical protein [Streptococcus caballi]
MANSILATMQGIEEEAKAILADYDAQIKELRGQSTQKLEQIKLDCDRETELELSELEEKLAKEKTLLQETLEQTIAKNDEQVRSVLSDKKDGLVQQIVDKVVEKYGN